MGILIVTSYLIVGLSQVLLPSQLWSGLEAVQQHFFLSSKLSAWSDDLRLALKVSVQPDSSPRWRHAEFNAWATLMPSRRTNGYENSKAVPPKLAVATLGAVNSAVEEPASSRVYASAPQQAYRRFVLPLEQIIDEQCRDLPTGDGIPAFQPGIGKNDVLRMLGMPTGTSGGYWPNTRAVFYELIPEQVSLGFLFDKRSERIRQTEASFTAEVDSKVVLLTLNGMLGCKLNSQIEQGLEQVRQGQSRQYSFSLHTLKGVIERQRGDRLYIGIWEADLH
jgi:hypothetical protein